MYIVVYGFKDLQDNDYIYKVGNYYPREGVNIEDVPKERIDELAGVENKIGKKLIKEIEDKIPKAETEKDETPEVEEDKTSETEEKAKANKKTKINKRCKNG